MMMRPERPERDTEQRLNWIWPGYSLWYWKAQVGRNGALQRGVNTLGSRQTCLHCAKQKRGLILGLVKILNCLLKMHHVVLNVVRTV